MTAPSFEPFGTGRSTPDDPGTAMEFVQRSRVKLTTNAKGMVQPEITVVEGTSEEELQRILDLALRSHEVAVRRLGSLSG